MMLVQVHSHLFVWNEIEVAAVGGVPVAAAVWSVSCWYESVNCS